MQAMPKKNMHIGKIDGFSANSMTKMSGGPKKLALQDEANDASSDGSSDSSDGSSESQDRDRANFG